MKLHSCVTVITLLGIVIIPGCSSADTANVLEGNQLYICDSNNFAAIDLNTDKLVLTKNKYYVQSIGYDTLHKRVIAPLYDPDRGFIGLSYWDGKSVTKERITDKQFVPTQHYPFENRLLMDSAMVHNESGAFMTEMGIYDTAQKTMLKKFLVPGTVKDIAGDGSTAYVTSYLHSEMAGNSGRKSNIYEVNLKTLEVRNIFPHDEPFVPFRIAYRDGYLYGVYWSAVNIPEGAPTDIFVKLDPKTGNILHRTKLNTFARDVVISSDGRYAFITHLPQVRNPDKKAPIPLSRIDLKTFEVTEAQGDYRPATIVEQNGKVYLGSDLKNELTVINESSLQVEKTIDDLPIRPDLIANERTQGISIDQ